MSLKTLKEVLTEAEKKGQAVGNFDIFNVEMLRGVIEAAEESGSPVILAYGEGFEGHIDAKYFSKLLIAAAEDAAVPVVVHMDHTVDLNELKKVMDLGFSSVMIDASDKDFDTNVETTSAVVEMAKGYDCSVESELGHVSGLGDLFEDDRNVYTDPSLAAAFVEKTGIDALAVAIGNAHGVYSGEPKIRFDILDEINQKVGVPLVLHGASGIPDQDIRRAIGLGIRKVNYYTDLCLAASECIRENCDLHFLDLSEKIVGAVGQAAKQKMTLLKG